jgi:hypothetical protein
MPSDTQLQEMSATAFAQAEYETAEARARAAWAVDDAESVRLHKTLRYPYPAPVESSPLADHDLVVLRDRLRKVGDDARSGGPPGVYVEAAADVERVLVTLQHDWVLRPEELLREVWGMLEGFGALIP